MLFVPNAKLPSTRKPVPSVVILVQFCTYGLVEITPALPSIGNETAAAGASCPLKVILAIYTPLFT